ncbi:MAG: cytochrome c [Hydrogenophaga sp.]|uniref:c-type cytochrome n=1 Tax=Hydrogenophaga sp. TaxID=1904254 RepID=UPI003D0DADB6
MRIVAPLALAMSVASFSAPALAQFQKPEDAVKYRKAVMTLMGNHAGRIGAMANGRIPFDGKAAADSSALLETLSKLPWEAFVAGTDKGETRAKPEIWAEQAKFKEGSDKLQVETAKLAAAAKTGNLDSVRTAFGSVGQTCKACHDAYQKN